jgi:hypothetical protein
MSILGLYSFYSTLSFSLDPISCLRIWRCASSLPCSTGARRAQGLGNGTASSGWSYPGFVDGEPLGFFRPSMGRGFGLFNPLPGSHADPRSEL